MAVPQVHILPRDTSQHRPVSEGCRGDGYAQFLTSAWHVENVMYGFPIFIIV